MENLDTIAGLIDSLDVTIESLEEALEPIFETPLEEKLAKCSTAEEKAKVYHDHIYITNSILFSYLKVAGVNTEEHPIMTELDRTKRSMNRLKKIITELEKKSNKDEAAKKRAAEFLQNTLGSSSGRAAPDSLMTPAISSANFRPKHKKFED